MKKAFTLAEVLVTLMIIGVIASMTIPGLKKSAEMRELAAGCKKAYSVLSQAIALAEQENGPSKRWGMTDADTGETWGYLKSHLNISKECIGMPGCLGTGEYYQLNGTRYPSLTANGYGSPQTAFQLADGMTGTFDIQPGAYYLFIIDVNGDKKPNKLGIDTFWFEDHLDDKGLIPMGTGINGVGDCSETGAGTQCAARVIKEGAINY